jgi:membrane dipeptidase
MNRAGGPIASRTSFGTGQAPHTTITAQHPRHGLESVMEHMERCVELVGIDHVAFGPDTNFGDHVAWHHEFSHLFGQDDISRQPLPPHDQVDYVHGCENPAEAIHNMICWLIANGYTDEDIAKLSGQNVLRVASSVWDH